MKLLKEHLVANRRFAAGIEEVQMAEKKKWMQDAVKHPGSLTKAAKAAGKSIDQYCQSSNLSEHRKKQCNLAKTFAKMRPH